MSYTKTNWQNNITPVNQTNMNKIENQLESLETKVTTLNSKSFATVPLNTASISSSSSPTASATITTHGRPVFVHIDGDHNALNAAAWSKVWLSVDGTHVRCQFMESTASSMNNPFSISYLATNLSAGSHTFSVTFTIGSGTATLAEAQGNYQLPSLIVFEI